MRKLIFITFAFLAFSACEVRHDHTKQVQKGRVANDPTQKNDVTNDVDTSWREVPLMTLPDEVEENDDITDDEAMEELERMMKGEVE